MAKFKFLFTVLPFAVVFLTRALSNEAFAASYNCDNAKLATEVATCQNDELSSLDEQVAEQYLKLRKVLTRSQGLQLGNEQRNFIKARNSCGDTVDCISRIYRVRNDELCKLGQINGYPCSVNGNAGTNAETCEVRLRNPVRNCPNGVFNSPDDCFEDVVGKAGDKVTSPAAIRILNSGYTYYCPSHESCIALKDLTFSKGCVLTYVPVTKENPSDDFAGYIFVGDAAWSREIE